jgi:hypothetical protein
MRLAARATASQVFSQKITQRQPHHTTRKMSVFATVRRAPPRLLSATSPPKIKLHDPRSSPTGRQDPTQNAVERLGPSPPSTTAQASLPHTSVFFPIMPSSSRKLMMMAWKYYSTIIQIQVADEGEAGEELVGWGVTLARRNGRNQTVTADEKIMENWGGDTTIINCTVIAGGLFCFLPIQIIIHSNIFECPRNGLNDNTQKMLPKWKGTTSHIFYSWSEQSLSSHIVDKHEHSS